MSTPFSSSLSEYQRGARAVGAKATLPLAAAAALASSAHGQAVVYTPTTHNVAQLGTGHLNVFVDFFHHTVGYSTSNSDSLAIGTHATGGSDDTDNITANFAFGNTGSDPFGGYPGRLATEPGPTNGTYATIGGYHYLGKLSRGTTINGSIFGDAQPYLNPPNAGLAPIWANSTGYAAVELSHYNNIYYGWLKLSVNSDGSQISVLSFGYNQTAGGAITAGQGLAPVPEPANVAALLAAGAAGLAVYRRRKQIVRAA